MSKPNQKQESVQISKETIGQKLQDLLDKSRGIVNCEISKNITVLMREIHAIDPDSFEAHMASAIKEGTKSCFGVYTLSAREYNVGQYLRKAKEKILTESQRIIFEEVEKHLDEILEKESDDY